MDRITITISDETSQQLYASFRIIKETFVSKSIMFSKLVDDIGDTVNLSVPCEEMADTLISILLDKPQNYDITEQICGLLDKFQLIEPMKQILNDHFCNGDPYDQLQYIERIYFATIGKSIWELSPKEWSASVESWWRWIKENELFESENTYNLDEVISKMAYDKFIEMTRYNGNCQDADAKLTYLWIENREILDERIIKNIGFANLTKPTRNWWLKCLSDTNNVIAMKVAIESLMHTHQFKYDTYSVKGVTSFTKHDLLNNGSTEKILFDEPSLPTMSVILHHGILEFVAHTHKYSIPTIQYPYFMSLTGHVSVSCGKLCEKDTYDSMSEYVADFSEEVSHTIDTYNIDDMLMKIKDDATIEPETKIEFTYDLVVKI